MSTEVTRKYSTSDAVLLIILATIIENAIANLPFLVTKRSIWANPFFPNLQTRIDTIIQTYLGVDNAKDLRAATKAVEAIQKQALTTLGEINTQIVADFKKDKERRDEILKTLGFKAYYQDAYKSKSQAALINLLYSIKQNLSATLKTEITTKGTEASSLEAVIGFADALKNANVTQETYKSAKPTNTAEAVNTFNNIYDDVMSVATIAAKFLKDDKANQSGFIFSKLLAAQKAISATTTTKAKKAATTPPPSV